jgi:2-amino-4-hydroxy-6-hydroxymethyldihydropteridine diphosphokinase
MNKSLQKVVLSLGSNKGDKLAQLSKAMYLLDKEAGRLVATSSVYEAEPWGFETDHIFYNMACIIETGITEQACMEIISGIELRAGRDRKTDERYTDRLIDIDIIFYGNKQFTSASLQLPHPRMHERKFVLMPVNEIAGSWIHPVLKKTVASLLQTCNDPLSIKKIHEPLSVYSH